MGSNQFANAMGGSGFASKPNGRDEGEKQGSRPKPRSIMRADSVGRMESVGVVGGKRDFSSNENGHWNVNGNGISDSSNPLPPQQVVTSSSSVQNGHSGFAQQQRMEATVSRLHPQQQQQVQFSQLPSQSYPPEQQLPTVHSSPSSDVTISPSQPLMLSRSTSHPALPVVDV
jgi:hypothetical protein